MEWAAYATNRANTGGTAAPGDFLRWGRERLNHFRREMRRLGQRNRVRMRTLYQSYYPVVSKATDYGP
jgi:hypothetical protein